MLMREVSIMRKNAGEKRKMILDYICLQHKKTGVYPSIREICKHMGFASTNTAAYHLRQLQQDGLIDRSEHLARSYSVSNGAEDDYTGIPIVGRVAAGTPILAQQNYDGQLSVETMFPVANAKLFALRVQGNSMIDAGILDGDLVIVQADAYIERGAIAVGVINEEATVKRIYDEGASWRLQPENVNLQPIYVNKADGNFSIAGKVIGVIRSL